VSGRFSGLLAVIETFAAWLIAMELGLAEQLAVGG